MSKKKKEFNRLEALCDFFCFLFFIVSVGSFALFGFLWNLRLLTGGVVCFVLFLFFATVLTQNYDLNKKAGEKK